MLPTIEEFIMTIGRICTREVFLADKDETTQEAARRMHVERVGTLVVVDDEQRPIGIVTDRDLALRVVGKDKVPQKTYVRDVMTKNPKTVPESTPIEMALEKMRANSSRRLLVVDGQGRLEGILSIDDVLELLTEEMESIGDLLDKQSFRPNL